MTITPLSAVVYYDFADGGTTDAGSRIHQLIQTVERHELPIQMIRDETTVVSRINGDWVSVAHWKHWCMRGWD